LIRSTKRLTLVGKRRGAQIWAGDDQKRQFELTWHRAHRLSSIRTLKVATLSTIQIIALPQEGVGATAHGRSSHRGAVLAHNCRPNGL